MFVQAMKWTLTNLHQKFWTDGSITAADAVAKSAAIMIGYLGNFTKLAHSADVVDVNTGEGGIVVDPVGSDNEEPAGR